MEGASLGKEFYHMKENVVFDSAKKAGTFLGKTIVCFAAGLMLVADTATRKRNYTTGNVNPTTAGTPTAKPAVDNGAVPVYTSGKKSRFVCRQCGAPVDVKSFHVAHGYVPGKGYLCDRCYAEKKGAYYSGESYDDDESVSTVCADCGKELKAKSFRLLRKYRIGNKYYCHDCYLKHEDD